MLYGWHYCQWCDLRGTTLEKVAASTKEIMMLVSQYFESWGAIGDDIGTMEPTVDNDPSFFRLMSPCLLSFLCCIFWERYVQLPLKQKLTHLWIDGVGKMSHTART